jgi:hypothetical protein
MVPFHKIVFACLFLILASSCGLVNEEEVIVPAYISVPSFTFETNPDNSQGANSQTFNDMWISDGGIVLGAIGTPALLPIQKHGATEIKIDAGISNTGQDNSRLIYPFVASYIQTKDLKPGVIDTIKPVFKYLAGTGFKFIEDFDRITRTFEFNSLYYKTGDTILAVNDKNSWRAGNFCGKVEMTADQDLIQLVTKEEYTLDGAGAPAFIEIDYKSNLPLDIGYYYIDPVTATKSSNNSVVGTYPNTEWKKLYVDLTGEITSRRAGTKYIIYIAVYNPDKIATSIYIDNIKLVYFK